MKKETLDWLDRAEEHLKAASVLLEGALSAQCVFFCQQAMEMLLKSIWIERAEEGLPPRTHDLVSLAQELALPLSEEQLAFLRELSEQYMPTRYADVAIEYSLETAEDYYRRMEGLFSWLRRLLN
jgi:HEPN domain-containing protein